MYTVLTVYTAIWRTYLYDTDSLKVINTSHQIAKYSMIEQVEKSHQIGRYSLIEREKTGLSHQIVRYSLTERVETGSNLCNI